MNEDGYTKREHDLIFNDIREALVRIETQTTTTNGKVADITKWRERVTGGLMAGSLIGLPIFIWAVVTLRDLPNDIREAVKTEISSKYDIQVK